jgi:cytochrome c556
MTKHRGAVTAVLALAGITGFAVSAAAQDKEAIVKERIATMKQQAANLKYISDVVKGVAGAPIGATDRANELLRLNDKLLGLFVAGTSSAEMPGKTHAKPEIWTDWNKFSSIVPVLREAEVTLADATRTTDRPAMTAALAEIGKNGCGACHSRFREKLPQ